MEKTREALVVDLTDAIAKIKKLESEKRVNYIRAIKSFGDKYSKEELETKELNELETIYDAGRRFYGDTVEVETEIIPMSTKMSKDTKIEIERIDFSRIFEDTNKDFDMSNLKIKTGK